MEGADAIFMNCKKSNKCQFIVNIFNSARPFSSSRHDRCFFEGKTLHCLSKCKSWFSYTVSCAPWNPLYITWVIYYLSYNSYFIIKSLVINWWDFKLFGYFKLFADFKYQYAVRIIGWWEHRFAPESRVSSIPNIKLRASSIHISESARGQLLKFCVLTVQKISNKSEQFSMLLAEQFSCII